MKLYYPIEYLETTDFNNHGGLNISSNKPCLILVQGDFCHFCTDSKPDFQKFANRYSNNIICLTSQIDGKKDTEQNLHSVIKKLDPSFEGGVPHYIFLKNGTKKSRTGKMTFGDLENFTA